MGTTYSKLIFMLPDTCCVPLVAGSKGAAQRCNLGVLQRKIPSVNFMEHL